MAKKTKNALKILHKRYVEGDPERKVELQKERINAQVAKLIYDMRKSAGISQKELASLVGTTQSAISRLENSDYEGHSFHMLERISKAVNQRIKVTCVAEAFEPEGIRHVFQIMMRKLRLRYNLSIEELAKKLKVRKEDIVALERSAGYLPTPMILYKLSNFFEVPQTSLNMLAGAIKEVPAELSERASRFAAQSESFEKLSSEERKILDNFVMFLKKEFRIEGSR